MSNTEELKKLMDQTFAINWTWDGVMKALKSFDERDRFCGVLRRLNPKEADQGKNWHRTFSIVAASEEAKMAAILVVFGVLRIDEVN